MALDQESLIDAAHQNWLKARKFSRSWAASSAGMVPTVLSCRCRRVRFRSRNASLGNRLAWQKAPVPPQKPSPLSKSKLLQYKRPRQRVSTRSLLASKQLWPRPPLLAKTRQANGSISQHERVSWTGSKKLTGKCHQCTLLQHRTGQRSRN